ncbi:thioredoxin-like [Actinia tenebrosa]|uniref:Thioredoxin n=1 Tax=Actinia tenebrosa TaxID=6105 RepID=A0A6P8IHD9_ACTTE|nr:thioredoxin-like [Actinia tenebrosa]
MREIKNRSDFDGFLKQQEHGRLIVIEFFADWCGPCRQIASQFKKIVEEFCDVTFAKVDVDENEDIAEDEKILAMPTFVLYKNGKMVETVVGANDNKLREAIIQQK